ncbi:MAG: C40 family peptidase [Pseudomonadota bacterium]|nr:MAG: C40 family peptidase [Pseudomonadota bacterium]
MRPRFVLMVVLLLLLAACSSQPRRPAAHHGYSEAVVSVANHMLGVPYRYGGRSPRSGFDCSGLVYYSHHQAGIELPRTTQDQFRHTRPVKRGNLRRGDLVFFRIKGRAVSHVGIYLGDRQFIHAPSSGKRVSVASLDNPYWQKRFVRGGRL